MPLVTLMLSISINMVLQTVYFECGPFVFSSLLSKTNKNIFKFAFEKQKNIFKFAFKNKKILNGVENKI